MVSDFMFTGVGFGFQCRAWRARASMGGWADSQSARRTGGPVARHAGRQDKTRGQLAGRLGGPVAGQADRRTNRPPAGRVGGWMGGRLGERVASRADEDVAGRVNEQAYFFCFCKLRGIHTHVLDAVCT